MDSNDPIQGPLFKRSILSLSLSLLGKQARISLMWFDQVSPCVVCVLDLVEFVKYKGTNTLSSLRGDYTNQWSVGLRLKFVFPPFGKEIKLLRR